ncbi:apoptotic chromatin condensation inducer in the nucleus isoform X2 [Strongylocentrotus purpuratus]|uniref:Uncharacterized protein n=1 Tax=Strongylocentrotus purpuratus TaxID=7668 RepID=A0A7M7P969_STRPU|nr:apoptotic chromatin condensation inducer in the nucleus isoform X2 [Strongylocentrotus purpuratus]
MNTSEESGEWTNPDGQNDRSMDDEEEEETEEEHETSSEIEEDYSVEEEEVEEEDEMEDEVENSRSESSPHMHINGHGNNDENDHDEDDEDEDEEDDDDSEEEGADIGVKEDYQSKQVQQNPIPQNGIHGGNPKMTSSPREHHFVTRQRDAVPVKQNGNMVARQDDGDEEEEEEEIEPGIIGPLHIDHVDFILDSIDAELSDLITKSDRGSPEERKKKNLTKKKTSSIKVSEGALQNGPQSANTTMETTLSQDHQVQPNGRYGMLPVRKKTKKTGKGRMKTRSQPSLASPPKLRINNFSMDDSVGTNSDADSITAEEVRRRVVQSLHQQEKSRSSSLPPHNQLTCSQEYHLATTPATNHNSNINSSPLQSPPTTADNSPNAKTAEVNNNEVETRKRMTGETKKGRTKPVGKTQEGRKKRSSVSSNSSKQSNRKVPSSEPASSTLQQGSPVSDVSGAFGSRGDGSNHIVRLRDILNHYGDVGEEPEKAASLATDYLVSQAAGVRNISDLESVATEDFESAFQKFAMPDSARSHRSKRQGKANLKQGKNSKPVNESAAQQLQRVKKSTSEDKKMKRTVSAPPVEPSGLPEYMYMHKEVSENDVGGDSMITEDYEAHFLAIPLKNIQTEHPGVTPKKSPSRSRRKGSSRARQTQPQSDPESVQTEDYEKRFHSMMVRRLAGVPLCSFDSVTIQSDLDSVKSLDIKKKFRKAMHKHESTSSIEEEDIQRSKVTPRSHRSKGSRSSSLQCQSSELLKMKATMQQTKKGNPQVMHPHHPTMHLTSPALHHSSMPNLSTAVLPGHSHPSVQPQTYAPPPPRDKWRSPPRVSHLESQPSPLRKRYVVT